MTQTRRAGPRRARDRRGARPAALPRELLDGRHGRPSSRPCTWSFFLLALCGCTSTGPVAAGAGGAARPAAQSEDTGAGEADPRDHAAPAAAAQAAAAVVPQDAPQEIWPTPAEPAAGAEDAVDSAVAAEAHSGPAVHGEVTARYRYRSVSGEADNDLLATLLLDVGDVGRDPVTAHIFGTTSLDIDGAPSGSSPAFADITDTYDSNLTGWVYEAYVDVHTVDDLETLRIGRQDVQETPVLVSFDGLRAESRPLGEQQIQLEGYGGIPAHHFESSSEGDLVFGLAGGARPWKEGRVRLDWMHLEDESLLGSHVDDLLGLELWQRIDQRLLLEGRGTMLESEARDMRLRGTYTDVAKDLVLEASWMTLFNPQSDLVQELDPFTATLLTLEPYDQVRFQGSKGTSSESAWRGASRVAS